MSVHRFGCSDAERGGASLAGMSGAGVRSGFMAIVMISNGVLPTLVAACVTAFAMNSVKAAPGAKRRRATRTVGLSSQLTQQDITSRAVMSLST